MNINEVSEITTHGPGDQEPSTMPQPPSEQEQSVPVIDHAE